MGYPPFRARRYEWNDAASDSPDSMEAAVVVLERSSENRPTPFSARPICTTTPPPRVIFPASRALRAVLSTANVTNPYPLCSPSFPLRCGTRRTSMTDPNVDSNSSDTALALRSYGTPPTKTTRGSSASYACERDAHVEDMSADRWWKNSSLGSRDARAFGPPETPRLFDIARTDSSDRPIVGESSAPAAAAAPAAATRPRGEDPSGEGILARVPRPDRSEAHARVSLMPRSPRQSTWSDVLNERTRF